MGQWRKILFALVLFLAVAIIGAVYIQYISRPQISEWDTTVVIKTLSSKPTNSVSHYFDSSEANTSAIVYADSAEFIKIYESDLAETISTNGIDFRVISEIVSQIDNYSQRHSEIDASELTNTLEKPNLAISEFIYENQLVETMKKLVNQGSVAVFDVEKNVFVSEIIHRDFGYICGELCGFHNEEYAFTDKRSFLTVYRIF